jgi:cysteine-rich repeat protein
MKRAWLLTAALSLGCSPGEDPPHLERARIAAGVERALATQPSLRVVVALTGIERIDEPARMRERALEGSGRLLAGLDPGDFRLLRRFRSVAALSGEVTRAGLERLASDPEVVAVSLDPPGRAALGESVPLIGAPQLQLAGYTGSGVTVAIVDSGIDPDHPDLATVPLVAEHCVCDDGSGGGCCPDASLEQDGPGSAADDAGHGTAVAAVVASQAMLAATGVAPGVSLVAVKVIDANNLISSSSQVVAALDWIATSQPDVDVVNMSLGSFSLFPGVCDGEEAWTMAYAQAIGMLRSLGVVVLASSANDGVPNEISAPACVDATVAVGAVLDADEGAISFSPVCNEPSSAADRVACFSNASPALDLLAPGAPITTSAWNGTTKTIWGTSFAAPHAAGAAALWLSIDPALEPPELEALFADHGVPVLDTRNNLTFPRVDVWSAAKALLPNTCGDGILHRGEDCDDGNTTSGDGCSGVCSVEPGFDCSGEPSLCLSECGDGALASDEDCDDGNTASGDGCSASCQDETTDSGSGGGGAGGTAPKGSAAGLGEPIERCRGSCCCELVGSGAGESGLFAALLALGACLRRRRQM